MNCVNGINWGFLIRLWGTPFLHWNVTWFRTRSQWDLVDMGQFWVAMSRYSCVSHQRHLIGWPHSPEGAACLDACLQQAQCVLKFPGISNHADSSGKQDIFPWIGFNCVLLICIQCQYVGYVLLTCERLVKTKTKWDVGCFFFFNQIYQSSKFVFNSDYVIHAKVSILDCRHTQWQCADVCRCVFLQYQINNLARIT